MTFKLLIAVALFGATAALDIEEDYYKLLNVKQDATDPQVMRHSCQLVHSP